MLAIFLQSFASLDYAARDMLSNDGSSGNAVPDKQTAYLTEVRNVRSARETPSLGARFLSKRLRSTQEFAATDALPYNAYFRLSTMVVML